MDSKHYTLAKELFGEVCDLPESERHAHLRQRTSDTGIIDYVEQLLLGPTDTDHPRVLQPVMHMMSAVAGSEIKVGDTLGAWKLVSEIGQGGMGTVFRAARSDGHFEQEAAVKLIHGIPSAKALEYLARERQILATLTHPNIARLYDGGATPHGQPYLVMEYVEGIAIDRYVRDNHLSVTRILKLMLAVCDAISFGRPYISNPDLVERLRSGAELTPDNYRTWYSPPVGERTVIGPSASRARIASIEVIADAIHVTGRWDARPVRASRNGTTARHAWRASAREPYVERCQSAPPHWRHADSGT